MCKNEPMRAVPLHLKDSHYAAAKKAGFGVEYKYPHDYEERLRARRSTCPDRRRTIMSPKTRDTRKISGVIYKDCDP